MPLKLLAGSLLLLLFASPSAAQELTACTLEGENLTLTTRVHTSARRFHVHTTGDVQAVLQGHTAHVQVVSYLAFAGRVPLEELKLDHPAVASLAGGVVRTDILPGMLLQPFARGESIEAGLDLGAFRTSRVLIPCAGFRLVSRSWRGPSAWRFGFGNSFFRDQRATIHTSPNAPAPVTLHGIEGYLVDVREERGRWSFVESDVLFGWVRTRELERYEREGTIGLGSVGSIGHGSGGGVGYPDADEGVIEVGSGVFGSVDSSEPWAYVRGSESVWLRYRGEWTEVVQLPDIDVPSGVMWVRSEHVRFGVSVRRGMTMVRRKARGRSFIEVTTMEESAGPEPHGLRVGDQIIGVPNVPQNEFDAGPIALIRDLDVLVVRRGGERIELVQPCLRPWLEHLRSYTGRKPRSLDRIW